MEYVWLGLAFLCMALGLLGAFLPVLPGPPLSFAGLMLLWFTDRATPSVAATVGGGLSMLIITLLDYLLPTYYTKKFKSSQGGRRGATMGMIVGLFLFPPWGILIGPVIGAFLGEYAATRNWSAAWNSGIASLLGVATGVVMKVVYGIWALGYGIWLLFL
ncbi:MAG: DUF456 family protein [Flavobacteriales bacterium]|nr:DUF456 family protein [Flavobacteriales bacterium]MCX7769358.1 DUF456 family protein [Flavobacteriales bacterium]MDW8410750.1 DUF456 family protein [Flavobacteriales bacterium]